MNGVTFFYTPGDVDEEVEYTDLPSIIQTHVETHIPYEDSGNVAHVRWCDARNAIHASRYPLEW